MTLLIIGIVLILAAIGAGVFAYVSMFSRGCNPPLPRRNVAIGNVSFDVEMATTMTEQSCGLSGREGLGERQGMFFPFGSGGIQSFWMKDMTFAIDMVWISGNRVVGFAENALPPAPGTAFWQLKIYTSPPGVDAVLEVPAGTVAKDNIHVGDTVRGL